MNPTRTSVYVILATALVFAFARWSRAEPKISCPDTSLGESREDCPWAGAARAWVAAAEAGRGKQITALLKKQLPDLDRSLQTDSRRLAWKKLWGRSINFDELANAIIVHPAIIQALGDRFGSRAPMMLDHFKAETIKEDSRARWLGKPEATDPAGHPLVHAGMEHTYGYLFSLLKTSFGYKRARWVEGEIERGFGLKPGLLSPRPESGTLFGNVTYLAGRIAFRGHEGKIAILHKGAQDVPAELRDFDFSKLVPIRLKETTDAKDATGNTRKVTLRTDLVPFLHAQQNSHLLVYSVDDLSNDGEVLITAFPVGQSFVDRVTQAQNLGDNKPVQTRYNGFVEGVSGHELKGSRSLVQQGWAP